MSSLRCSTTTISETNDFFRWKVTYRQDELSELVRERTGINFGRITSLEPLDRGTSGRITRLRITGDLKSMVIGKELEIRKALSKTHLYSSAFIVEQSEENGEILFVLKGAGWGHGVGLCQIGAAVMGRNRIHLQADSLSLLQRAQKSKNSTEMKRVALTLVLAVLATGAAKLTHG